MNNEQLDSRIDEIVREGVVARAGQLYMFFAVTFVLFSVYTHRFLFINDPSITMWDNVWPRLLINVLPFAIIGTWLRKNAKSGSNWHIFASLALFPLLTAAGACVYIWPQIYQGHIDIFYAMNATNIYAFSIWFVYLSLSIGYSIAYFLLSWLFFFVPLYMVLHFSHAPDEVITVFLNDAFYACAVSIYGSVISSRLHRKVIRDDMLSKDFAKRFLGDRVSTAIFENRSDLLKETETNAVIMALDLRGYSNFVLNNSHEVSSKLMGEYHAAVSDVVSKYGGFIHKTAGDGHIVSFGLMDDVALEDIGIPDRELRRSDLARKASLVQNAVRAFDDIHRFISDAVQKTGATQSLRIAGGLDFGKVSLKLIGSKTGRQEYDIHGSTVICAARLEGFSKIFFDGVDMFSAMLVLSPEAVKETKGEAAFERLELVRHKIRNFEAITSVYLHCEKSESMERAA